jgi:excisionase family DNA binding protein
MSGSEGGTIQLSVPAAARRLGISERAVRKRIEAGTLPAERDGSKWVVTGPITDETAVPPEPIEAEYRVTPEVIEAAIERTGDKYVADMQVIFDRVGRLYEAHLAAKDETIAALHKVIAGLESQQPEKPEPKRSWWSRLLGGG